MRKTLLFVFALLYATAAMAQTRAVYLEETFNGNALPAGWTKVGAGTSNWSISSTNNAGGQANELLLNWSPQFNGLARFVSPVIDLTGLNSVVISFKHCLDNYSGSHTLGIATTSDGGNTWNQAWTQNYSTDGSYAVTQQVTTTDVGSANFQFCIFYNGNSYNMDNWFFDDIIVFTLENLDVAATGTNLPDIQGIGNISVSLDVLNYGSTTVTSIEASYEVNGMEPVVQTFTVNLGSLATTSLNFTQPIVLENPGSYTVTFSVLQVNGEEDDVAENNTLVKTVSVPLDYVQRFPMMEHFTSSTCPPCVGVNNSMLTFCNNNPGRYTYTKYQMNWPGNGDPYYTAEGGVRRTYYGISAVPNVIIDGVNLGSTAVNQNTFNQHADEPGYFDVRGSFTVDGNNIHVIADVMPYVDVEARVYITVNEKLTTGNVGSNGETQFRHVMMKMLPNAEGSTVAFTGAELQRLEFTQNMSGTHVEEMSDLEVSIWVQHYGSKYVYNSHYAYEYTDIHPYPVENLTLTEANAPRGMMVAAWDAPTEGNPTGYNVYVNNELVAENITDTEYAFEGDSDVFYVVGVVALYPNEQTSVKTVAVVTESVQDMGLYIAGSPYIDLTIDEPTFDAYVINGNYASHEPIEITAMTESNPTGDQYLVIEPSHELPYTINEGEEFFFNISPNALAERSIAETIIKVESSYGDVFFNVTVDGELLSISEVASTTKIYPNPANASVSVVAENDIESVKVYNVLGALVETIPANGKSVNVSLNGYSNGIYFFNIRHTDGTVSNQRVVVSH